MTPSKKPGVTIVKPGSVFTEETVLALLMRGDEITPEVIGKFTFHAGDNAEIAASIEAAELGAESAEELFGGSDARTGKDSVGEVFSLTDVTWQPSKKLGEGLPFYAVLHVVYATGEVGVITCGARSVVRKAAKAKAEGWLPRWLVITSSDTASGNEALDLAAAPKDQIPFAKN